MSGVSLKLVEPSINFGIINFITKLHLVGTSTESDLHVVSVCICLVYQVLEIIIYLRYSLLCYYN